MKYSDFVLCLGAALAVLLLCGCVTVRMSTANGKSIASWDTTASEKPPASRNITVFGLVETPSDVIANLPRDQALAFLRTLYIPEAANSCRFEKDGVSRWWKKSLPGSTPYSSIYLSLGSVVKDKPSYINLSIKGSNEWWCIIVPYPIAEHQGSDTKKFTNKIFTALKSLGATIIPASVLAKGLRCRAEWCQPARAL